jgi:phosphoglycerate kinase
VLAHLGRPKGGPQPDLTLAPVAECLASWLPAPVQFAGDVIGEQATKTVSSLAGGEVAVLENLRFEPGETSKDDAERGAFADRLAAFGDVYVDDAFGAVHRRHASVVELPARLPHAAGGLVLDEVAVLDRLLHEPERPYAVVLGGAKVSDKLAVIGNLLGRVDRLLVGGGMCFTFLAAQGHAVGDSLVETDQVDACRELLASAGDRLRLPTDIVVAPEPAVDAVSSIVPADAIPAGMRGLDVGPQTVSEFAAALADARTVFWNGPMGVFELTPFASGTLGVARAVAAVAGFTVVGGGDSAAAIRALGLDEAAYSHVSTGGGASLEYLEGRTLPGLAALER